MFDVRVPTAKSRQRDDWRSVAERLGPAKRDRVIVVAPAWQVRTLKLYLPRIVPLSSTTPVTEVNTVVYNGFVPAPSRPQARAPGPPFRLVGRWTIQRMTVSRFRAASPTPVSVASLGVPRADRSVALPFFQRAG
jgi:hypothetical protein